ncbi:hypothetical protein SAMN05444722_2307 [Rhodovulum sp. ES.010]|uniref:hypothetical protein n=1 Tax=Rhodovulum sp. ES.010 TaxID=1882821 RepID=UPI000929E860|nr:hypothetical protein [Rhodovulum sp. ES.010]SIO46101.1 hypothetical protein SAMN05444722_2307 [Rhodovulum sp. ES.010]
MTFPMRLAVLGLALCLAGPAARAQTLLEDYVAVIGRQDLFNSRGVRLTEPWQILRQDRANVHRYGLRDPGDQGDAFFGDFQNRAIMERMLMQGWIAPAAARDIVAGGATVLVQVWGQGGRGAYVTVDVYR